MFKIYLNHGLKKIVQLLYNLVNDLCKRLGKNKNNIKVVFYHLVPKVGMTEKEITSLTLSH